MSIKRSESKFSSSWMHIQDEFMKMKKEDDPNAILDDSNSEAINIAKKAKDKNTKGRHEKFEDKISAADIKNWKEHKYDFVSFMELMKSLFISPDEARYTFENTYDKPSHLPDVKKFNTLEENDIEYKSMDEKLKLAIESYGNAMLDMYLKNGLSKKEALRRKEEYGPNKLPEKIKKSELLKFIEEITNPFSNLLWLCAILALIVYGLGPSDPSNLILAIVIFTIVIVTGFFSYVQNGKSESVMESIKAFSSAKCEVIRQGSEDGKKEQKINVVDLVPGDVIEIKSGEKIPADIRVIKYSNLKADCSALTGESIAITMSDKCGDAGKEDPLKSRNILFFSTLCKDGTCKGVVIKTGPNTFMGKIADLTSSAEGEATSLQKEINNFVIVIAGIAIFLGILFFSIGMGINQGIQMSIGNAIGILTANIPQGLVSAITVLLSLTASRMLKHKIMVKNLQSVETLGSITCICSDKTGTLTQNKMTVVHLWYDKIVKKVNPNQEDIRIDSEIVKMENFSKDDESFKVYKFAGVCGSGSSFLQDVPDDYDPFVLRINQFKDKNKRATEKQIEEAVSKIKAEVREEYLKYYKSNIDDRLSNGDASETGILKFFEKQEPIENIRLEFPIHSIELEGGKKKEISIPFNSENKFAAYLRKNTKDGGFWLAMKGAPERIIERCNRYLYQGREITFKEDPNFHIELKKANKCFALKGERVIGLAYCRLDPSRFPSNFNFEINIQEGKPMETNLPVNDLCFVGLIAMEDPPRPGVKEAIALCKKAGIKVIMVTGDQTLTAASIAYQIGIIENLDDTPEIIKETKKLATIEEAENFSQAIIIAGDRLYKKYKEDEVLSEDNPNKGLYLVKWVMKRDVVFARTSPEQKLIIVSACQRLNHCVAVTGDGVNDSPAIKKSDIGIAMGKVGTDVAKEAADIILLDDNFASIVKGIKRGRVIFDNLKKICAYNMTSNVAELYPFLLMTFLSFPQPLTPILCLCLDVFANVYPDVSFAYEIGEANIMTRKPRNSKTDRLCPLVIFGYAYFFIGFFEFCGAMLNFFVVLNDYGIGPFLVIGLSNIKGIGPEKFSSKDYPYNPQDQLYFGNTFAFQSDNFNLLGMDRNNQIILNQNVRSINILGGVESPTDLRVLLYKETQDNKFNPCLYPGIGMTDEVPNCYAGDIINMAQGSYLVGIMTLQTIVGLIYRTISTSIYVHPLRNWSLNSAYFIEIGLISLLVYTPGLNKILGFRALIARHWCPTLTFTFVVFYFDEFRKFLVRIVKRPDNSPGWFADWFFF